MSAPGLLGRGEVWGRGEGSAQAVTPGHSLSAVTLQPLMQVVLLTEHK